MTTPTTADFRMLRPVSILDANVTSITVPEAVVATYSAGTTYALGDRAGAAPVYGKAQTVYQSLQNANTGHTQASSPTWWEPIGAVYPVYASGSTCGLGDIVSSIGADVHLLYESLVASNTGNALTDSTKWLPLGSTNARAMFDNTYGSQTTNAESIVAVLAMGVLTTMVYVGNLGGSAVRLQQSVTGFDQTQQLNSHLVDNWYDWYYEDIVTVEDVVFTDVPPYAGSTLTLTITNTGDIAKCGIVCVGKPVTLGVTQWETVGSNINYSGTTVDGFGNVTFAPHGNVTELNLEVDIYDGFESEAERILRRYVDTPTVFIGSTDYSMLTKFGTLGTWNVPISTAGKFAQIQIKGLNLLQQAS